MYGIDGALKLDEFTLDHLEGYRGSAPVRLWEMRGLPRHHIHGKLMSWTGMDRAGRLLDAKWSAVAQRIEAEIRKHAAAPENGCLRQAYDGGTDVAVLLAPMLGFELQPHELTKTIANVREALESDGFLARYKGDEGLSGGEGEFLVCTSWLADAQMAAGQIDEARAAIEKRVVCAKDVGLYTEEIDSRNGEFLGNFQQALTHLGLIASVVNLQLVERGGVKAVSGSYADRARRAVRATFGWRGVVAAMIQSNRITHLTSSKRSQLAWP